MSRWAHDAARSRYRRAGRRDWQECGARCVGVADRQIPANRTCVQHGHETVKTQRVVKGFGASQVAACGDVEPMTGIEPAYSGLGSCFLPDALAGVALHFACGTALLAARFVHRRALWHIHTALARRLAVVARGHEARPKPKLRVAWVQAHGPRPGRWWGLLFVRLWRRNAPRPTGGPLGTFVTH
jgi:hypothetical protein